MWRHSQEEEDSCAILQKKKRERKVSRTNEIILLSKSWVICLMFNMMCFLQDQNYINASQIQYLAQQSSGDIVCK